MGKVTFILSLLALFAYSTALAQQDTRSDAETVAPPMGPPGQMEEVAFLIGTWTVDMKWRMSPESEWQQSTGEATYTSVLDGGGLMMEYTDETMMPEMPVAFRGLGIQTYDRETGQWQMSWVDNVMCRQSLYTGNREGDKTVLSGEDLYGGMKMQSRITTYNESPDGFDWKMENSYDGGKTWFVSGQATYTRKM